MTQPDAGVAKEIPMRLTEWHGPEQASSLLPGWRRRVRLWRRVGLALRAALRPRVARVPSSTLLLEFHAEACAPEGAQVTALYADGRLVARFEEGRRL